MWLRQGDALSIDTSNQVCNLQEQRGHTYSKIIPILHTKEKNKQADMSSIVNCL